MSERIPQWYERNKARLLLECEEIEDLNQHRLEGLELVPKSHPSGCLMVRFGFRPLVTCDHEVQAELMVPGAFPKYEIVARIDVDFPPELSQQERVAQGMSTTGYHLVNAVEPVCEAEKPGIKTFLDLPMITGCMGIHERVVNE